MFINAVTVKHPPEVDSATCARRKLQEVNFNKQCQGIRPYGRHGRGIWGGNQEPHRTRTDSNRITLTDGQKIDNHPSLKFTSNVYNVFKPYKKAFLHHERTEYQNNHSMNNCNQSLQIQKIKSQLRSYQSGTQLLHSVLSTGKATQVTQINK